MQRHTSADPNRMAVSRQRRCRLHGLRTRRALPAACRGLERRRRCHRRPGRIQRRRLAQPWRSRSGRRAPLRPQRAVHPFFENRGRGPAPAGRVFPAAQSSPGHQQLVRRLPRPGNRGRTPCRAVRHHERGGAGGLGGRQREAADGPQPRRRGAGHRAQRVRARARPGLRLHRADAYGDPVYGIRVQERLAARQERRPGRRGGRLPLRPRRLDPVSRP